MHTPPPPWHLTGQAAVFLRSWREVELLVSYDTSPVGPYEEYAIATLTMRGASITLMEVTSESSRQGGRANWGFPKVVAPLESHFHRGRWTFRRHDRSAHLRPFGPSISIHLKAFTIQNLGGKPVRVPTRVEGRACLALRGSQIGIFLPFFELTVETATPLP